MKSLDQIEVQTVSGGLRSAQFSFTERFRTRAQLARTIGDVPRLI